MDIHKATRDLTKAYLMLQQRPGVVSSLRGDNTAITYMICLTKWMQSSRQSGRVDCANAKWSDASQKPLRQRTEVGFSKLYLLDNCPIASVNYILICTVPKDDVTTVAGIPFRCEVDGLFSTTHMVRDDKGSCTTGVECPLDKSMRYYVENLESTNKLPDGSVRSSDERDTIDVMNLLLVTSHALEAKP